MHGNGHAGFGGRPAETDRWQHRHRAAGRPHTFRLRVAEVLGPDRPRPAAGLHRRHRGRSLGPVRASSPRSGASPIRRSAELWQNAWTEFVPFLDYDVEIRKIICSHERHREHQRPLPASGPGPRPLPHRTGRAEVPLPGHPIPRPDRQGQGTMGDEVEARPQRVRHHLRRPDHRQEMITDQIRSTVYPSGSMIESGGLAPPYLLPSWLLSVLRPAGLIRVFRFGLRGAWSSP